MICGHIHQPCEKEYVTEKGKTIYLNSGDWIENLTALEFEQGKWNLYTYNPEEFAKEKSDKQVVKTIPHIFSQDIDFVF